MTHPKWCIVQQKGHIYDKDNPGLQERVVAEISKMAYTQGVDTDVFIQGNISGYAKAMQADGHSELLPELNSMYNGNNYQLTEDIFKEIGAVYENRP